MTVGVRRMIAYTGLLSGLILFDSKSALSQQNPVLTLSTNQVNFFSLPTGGTATQTLTLNTTGSAAVTVNTTGAPSWLQVSPNGQINVSAGTPTTLTITATPPAGLAPGSYDSVLSFGVQGSTAAPQTVVVTAFVTGASILSAKPSSLTFTAQPGAVSATPPTQSVTISSSGAMLDYTATATTSNGQNWLIPFTSTGTTGNASFAGSPLVIGVNPAGLTAGTYLGQVLVQSATTQDSVTIAVALTVGANSSLTVTPSALQPFFSQANAPGTSSLTQTLTVTSTSSSANFSVSVNPAVTWLGAAIAPPTTTTTSGSSNTITLTVMPIQTPGNYNTTLTITNGTSKVSIPVSYTVGNGPVPQVTPTQLTFATSASQIPASQTVQVSLPAGGNPIGISATSNVPWLTVSSSSQVTPVTLTVAADPAGLAAGTYNGIITVRPTNGDQYAIPISVALTVTGTPPLLTSGPPVLLFTNQIGQGAPPAQLLQLNSNAQVLSFATSTTSTTTTNCPANFLQASALSANPSTPSAVAVSVNPAGLTAGMCSGTITVTYGNPGATGPIGSIQVPVIVETSATPLLSISVPAGFGFETANSCSANSQCSVIMRQITLTSTDGLSPMSFSASAMNNGTIPWLFVAPNSSQTPAVLTVLIDPNGLTAGTYYGSITINSTQSNPSGLPMPITIPVSLTIRSASGVGTTVTASVSSLSFNETSGGPAPASQTFTLTSSASGPTYSATIPSTQNCSWVQLSPMSGAATGTITVGVNSSATSLAQNTYACSIVLNLTGAATASIPITATLIVSAGGTGSGIRVTASPTTINFTETVGGAAPASQTVTLTSSGTGATYTTVLPTTANCGWLQATPSSGAASGTMTISVAPNTLAANTYPCTLTLTLSGAAVASISITANLTVTAGQSGQSQTITVAPPSLSFNYSAATPQPAAQQLVVSNSASSTTSANFTITAQSSGWLSVTPASGTAPANITVSANPQNAGTGSAPFSGTITITPAGGGTPITVPVTLNNQ
jgi:hypothetical protein